NEGILPAQLVAIDGGNVAPFDVIEAGVERFDADRSERWVGGLERQVTRVDARLPILAVEHLDRREALLDRFAEVQGDAKWGTAERLVIAGTFTNERGVGDSRRREERQRCGHGDDRGDAGCNRGESLAYPHTSIHAPPVQLYLRSEGYDRLMSDLS